MEQQSYYLVINDDVLFVNKLKVELAKDLDEEYLNNFFENDLPGMLDILYTDIIINGKSSSEANKENIGFKMWLQKYKKYGIEIWFVNKDGLYKTITMHELNFINQSNYKYDKRSLREPLILEPEDWNEAEWATILKLFGMKEADRIKVEVKHIESFGILEGGENND